MAALLKHHFNRAVRLMLHPAAVALMFLVCLFFLKVVEGPWPHMPFVAAVMLTISALVYLFSKRVAFSLYVGMAVVCLTTLMSIVKYRSKGFDLHVYDIVFTGADREAMDFLATEFGHLIVPVLMVLLAALAGLTILWRADTSANWRWPVRGAIFGCCIAMLPISYPLDADKPRYFHYLGGFNVSSFYISFADIPVGKRDDPLRARLDKVGDTGKFTKASNCGQKSGKNGDRPDIFFVLSESAVDFNIFPQLGLDGKSGTAFRSQDGQRRKLRVETFGGGTWVTNLSLMTGLSSNDFGWRAPYLTTALENHVHESLPKALARCGYRTVALLPMKHGFVNEGAFLESIGFETVLDHNAIGAQKYAHRDSFYFEAAERFIEKHRKEDGRPLFLEIQTMFAHSPWSHKAEEGVEPTNRIVGLDPEMREYVRRVLISQDDFKTFLERRKSDLEDRPSVVLEFGDHQSFATKALADEIEGSNSIVNPRSIAYQTYYSVHGFGRDLDLKPLDWPDLDVAFLGTSFLQAAGLPLSPMHVELAELRDQCSGRFHACADRQAVDRHLKKRVNSGLLRLP